MKDTRIKYITKAIIIIICTVLLQVTAIVGANEVSNSKLVKSDILYTGEFGSVAWEIDSEGTMYLSGGEFINSSSSSQPSWAKHNELIKKIIFNDEVIAATNSSGLFYNLINLEEIINIDKLNTSNVESMYRMFELAKPEGKIKELDLSKWNTEKVTDMGSLFKNQVSLTNLKLQDWDTSNVKNMSSMFENVSALESINLENFNTANVTTLQYMFSGTTNMSTIGLKSFDTSKVKDISYMFQGSGVEKLDLSGWNTSNITSLSSVFRNAEDLNELNIENWDVSNVTDIYYTFHSTTKLEKLELSSWDTSKVTTMLSAFNGSGLYDLDVSTWDVSNVKNLGSAFADMKNLKEIKINDWNIAKVTSFSRLFYNVTSVTELDLSSWRATGDTLNLSYMFSNMTNLKKLDLGQFKLGRAPKVPDHNRTAMLAQTVSLQEINLSKDISFLTDASIPPVKARGYTGRWIGVENGKIFESSRALENEYRGGSHADTYVWEKSNPRIYSVELVDLTEKSVDIEVLLENIEEPVNTTVKLFKNSGDQEFTGIEMSISNLQNEGVFSLDIESLNVFNVYRIEVSVEGIDEIHKSTTFTTIPKNTTIDLVVNRALSASDFQIRLSEVSGIDDKKIIELAGARAFSISDSSKLIVTVDRSELKAQEGMYPIIFKVGNITREVTCEVLIINLNELDISKIDDVIYNGKAHTPRPTITNNETSLTINVDYGLEYINNINAGEATIIITGKKDYSGEIHVNFTIKKALPTIIEVPNASSIEQNTKLENSILSGGKVQGVDLGSKNYEEVEGKFVWANPLQVIVESNKYEAIYQSNNPNYEDVSMEVQVNILLDINNFEIEEIVDVTYNKQPHTPIPIIKVNDKELVVDKDFTLSYYDNINAGIARIEIVGIGEYVGNNEVEFNIKQATPIVVKLPEASDIVQNTKLENSTLSGGKVQGVDLGSKNYEEVEGEFVWANPLQVIVESNKYEAIYQSNNPNYEDVSMEVQVNILLDINNFEIEEIVDVTYNKQPHTPIPIIKVNDKELVVDKDFTLSYYDNVNAGIARIEIVGIGEYVGNNEVEFNIKQATPIVVKLPEASMLEEGSELKNSSINGGVFHGVEFEGEPEVLKGELNWKDENIQVYNSSEFEVQYLPNDKNYHEISFSIYVEVNIIIDINDLDFFEMEDVIYQARPWTPVPIIFDGDTILEYGKDFNTQYEDNINVGQAIIKIEGINQYKGAKTLKFSINKATPFVVSPPFASEIEKNNILEKSTLSGGLVHGVEIDENKFEELDGMFTWEKPDTLVTTTDFFNVIFMPNSSNYNEIELLVEVSVDTRESIKNVSVQEIENVVYSGREHKPEVIISFNDDILIENNDYKLVYSNNINAGQAIVIIQGINDFKDEIKLNFEIDKATPKLISKPEASVINKGEMLKNSKLEGGVVEGVSLQRASNEKVEGTFIWSDETIILFQNSLSKVSFISEDNNYKNLEFEIEVEVDERDNINIVSVSNVENVIYTAHEHRPVIELFNGLVKLVENEDYTIDYENNLNAGTASIIITGIDQYKDCKEINFEIDKALPIIVDLSAIDPINSGDKLKQVIVESSNIKGVEISDGIFEEVQGSFVWKNPNQVITFSQVQQLIFKSANKNYQYVELEVEVMVNELANDGDVAKEINIINTSKIPQAGSDINIIVVVFLFIISTYIIVVRKQIK